MSGAADFCILPPWNLHDPLLHLCWHQSYRSTNWGSKPGPGHHFHLGHHISAPLLNLKNIKVWYQEGDCRGVSLNNSCEADTLSCYYIDSLNRTDAVHLLYYQVSDSKETEAYIENLGCGCNESRPEFGKVKRGARHSKPVHQQLFTALAFQGFGSSWKSRKSQPLNV